MNWKLIIGIGVIVVILAYVVGGLTWRSSQNIDNNTQESQGSLESTNWSLDQLSVEGEMEDLVVGSTITAKFENEEVGGKAGCNNYFASYELGSSGSIEISQAGSTMMYCEPKSLMAQETAYLGLLSLVTKYEVSKNSLLMYDDSEVLILSYQESTPVSLEGTNWQATGINNNKGDLSGVVSAATTNLTTAYMMDGQIQGFGCCNDYNGTYTVDGNQITMGPLTSTFKACEEDLMKQEQDYFAALEKTEVYQVKDDRLEFRNSAGSLQVSYQIAE